MEANMVCKITCLYFKPRCLRNQNDAKKMEKNSNIYWNSGKYIDSCRIFVCFYLRM
jgi:hypothetical protein